MVLLCVPCGALYKPIEFKPIYDENLIKTNENGCDKNKDDNKMLKKHNHNGIIGLILIKEKRLNLCIILCKICIYF